jgi:chitinase
VSGETGSGDPNNPTSQFETRDLDPGTLRDFTGFSSYDIGGLDDSLPENIEILFPRGKSRFQAICGNSAGATRNTRTNSFRTQPYPPVTGLISAGRHIINQAKPLGCAAAGLVASTARTIGSKYVAEHVNELQSVKSFAQSMIDAVLPGGGQLSTGKIPYIGIFDLGGKFQQAWSALGVTPPAVGTSPESTIYSVLGSLTDTNNLLILEAKINSLKAIVRYALRLFSKSCTDQKGNFLDLGGSQEHYRGGQVHGYVSHVASQGV